MYKTTPEAVDTAQRLVALVADSAEVDIMIAPVFTALDPVSQVVRDSRVALGAQNLFWEKEGAYTGEISADMLVAAGCQYVIIGHSERRQYFGETDETVNKKIRAAIDAGLIPVLCVGETEAEREAGQTFSVLDKQVKKGLDKYFAKDLGTLVIAYEPVWAIGTGKTASPEQAQDVHAFIRSRIASHSAEAADGIQILYGGSVNAANAADLLAKPDIDGGLIGGASLKVDDFLAIGMAANA
jgi:triosephosphate isomerase